ncbi:YciI family protein [Kribbella sp. NPDC049584]|uniref:YciI family protein n=1 Tax=Kribbella sp. NPDC049584 TaxID=3154833 RepID=UPI0034256093
MAKYMLIMRGTDESNAAVMAGFEELAASTYQFIEELMKAGVFIAAEGLDDAAESVVVDFSGEAPVVTDGPYGETKELFGGYFMLDVASKQEAVEWAKRLPSVSGSKIEVRRVAGEDERPPGHEESAEARAGAGSTEAGRESAGAGAGEDGERESAGRV